jgi:hypothetical protein
MIVFQSSATALRPCPFGTFENSPAIYGWVRGSQQIPSPARDDRNHPWSFRFKMQNPDLSACCAAAIPIKVSQGQSRLFKGFWKKRLFIFYLPAQTRSRFSTRSKPFQAVPSRSKPFQGFFQKKKIVYFF